MLPVTRPNRPCKTCRLCGEPAAAGESLTHRGYHFECGQLAAQNAAREMAARRGPAWDRWLQSRGPLGVNQFSGGGSGVPARRQSAKSR